MSCRQPGRGNASGLFRARAPCARGAIAATLIALGTLAGPAWAERPAAASAGAASAGAKPAPRIQPIDINSASRAQLKTLPGIGDAQAQKIIAGRPYRSKAELVSKGVLPEGPYLSLRRRIAAVQKVGP